MLKNIKLTERKVVQTILMIISVTIIVISIFGDKGLIELRVLKNREQELILENKQLLRERKTWIDKIDSMKKNNNYIETLAREKLGLVKENEIIFKLETSKSNKKN